MIYQHYNIGLNFDNSLNFRKPLLPHIYIQYTEILFFAYSNFLTLSEHKVSLSINTPILLILLSPVVHIKVLKSKPIVR